VLKEENSKLREIVNKNGDAEKLREENYKMRHELMIMRNAHSYYGEGDDQKKMLSYELRVEENQS
jgi:hypothetical protein